MREPGVITVAVVEDHPLYADALVRLVQGDPGMRVVSASASIAEMEDKEKESRADVVLLDLNLPGLSGVPGVRRLVQAGRVVLVLSAAARPETVAEVVAAGARGYLTKNADGSEVASAVRTLAGGGHHVPEGLAAGPPPAPSPSTAGLTHRETEVLARLAAGATDAEIAASLVISVRTVSSHLDRIREKTGRRRRPDLTRLAYEAGLVGPPRGHG